MKNNKKLKHLMIDAILCALIAILTFVPYVGFIPLGFTSVTDVHVVVILGAILLGPKDGLLLGIWFGLCSLLKSNQGTTSDAIFMWPWVSILPRALFGFFTGIIYDFFRKFIKNKAIRISVTAFISTVLHTILVYIVYVPTFSWVMGYGFHLNTSFTGQIIAGHPITLPIWLLCLAIFGFSSFFEGLLAVIVTAPINSALEIKFGEDYFKDYKNTDKNDNEENEKVL